MERGMPGGLEPELNGGGRESWEASNLWGGRLKAAHGLRVGEMEKVSKVPEGKGRRAGGGGCR
jgi:hypothetical protein